MLTNENPIHEFRGPFGVPIQVGASVLLLPLMLVELGGSARSIMYDLIWVAMVIGSVFLHELGHAWASLIQGVRVRRIMIYGMGGFCERAVSASRREQEFIVAMGPIVNLALWAVCSIIASFLDHPVAYWMFHHMATINLWLAIFNLLPISPLDGGKIFELLLMRLMLPRTATRIAGWVGLVFLLPVGLLFLIGMFHWVFLLFFIPSTLQCFQMAMGRA